MSVQSPKRVHRGLTILLNLASLGYAAWLILVESGLGPVYSDPFVGKLALVVAGLLLVTSLTALAATNGSRSPKWFGPVLRIGGTLVTVVGAAIGILALGGDYITGGMALAAVLCVTGILDVRNARRG